MDEYGNLCKGVVILGYVLGVKASTCIIIKVGKDMSFGSSPRKCQLLCAQEASFMNAVPSIYGDLTELL
jgi:hypothetical protein